MSQDIYTEPSSDEMPISKEVSVESDNAEAIVQSVIEATSDSKKVRFLGYRASGFNIRESLALVGIHEKTLSRWREADPTFVAHESRLPELRKTLGTEFAHMEFMRNYRLILEKDFQVITKSLSKKDENTLSQFEGQYLLKARSHYTPQQLQIMQQLVGIGEKEAAEFNFKDFILTLSRTKTTDSISVSSKEG